MLLDTAHLWQVAPAPQFCCNAAGEVTSLNDRAAALLGEEPSRSWRATTAALKSPSFEEVWLRLSKQPQTVQIVRGTLAGAAQSSFICQIFRPVGSEWAVCSLVETPLFDAVYSIVSALASRDRLEPILELIATQTRRVTGATRAYFKLYEPETERLRYHGFSSVLKHERFPEESAGAAAGVSGQAFQSKQSLNIPDVRDVPRWRQHFDDVRSAVLVPLLVNDARSMHKSHCLGVLVATKPVVDGFDPDAIQRLTLLTALASLGVREFETRTQMQNMYSELLETVRATQDSLHVASLLHDAHNFLRSVGTTLEDVTSELSQRPFSSKLLAQLDADKKALNAKKSLMRSMLDEFKRAEHRVQGPERSELVEVAQQVQTALTPREHNIALSIDCQFEECWIGMRPSLARIVLFNLVNNSLQAIRATRKAGVVRIRIQESPARKGYVRIEVEDDGPGMKKSIREALQAAHSTSDTPGGLGLGLMTVRENVADAGGSIAIDSHLGRGTTIRIDLPTE